MSHIDMKLLNDPSVIFPYQADITLESHVLPVDLQEVIFS